MQLYLEHSYKYKLHLSLCSYLFRSIAVLFFQTNGSNDICNIPFRRRQFFRQFYEHTKCALSYSLLPFVKACNIMLLACNSTIFTYLVIKQHRERASISIPTNAPLALNSFESTLSSCFYWFFPTHQQCVQILLSFFSHCQIFRVFVLF